jgi:UDP-2,4-diacetamido-2,4,6-trideoxy-beta-L-altropyranose hydrolase
MNVLLRADADVRMGTGHVMRCLALAQACQDAGGKATLATASLPPGLQARWAAEGSGLERLSAESGGHEDAAQTIILARRLEVDWVVVDGYQFSAHYHRAIKQAGFRLLIIDDFGHADHYCADLVLNQNLHADQAFYSKREPYSRLLLGTRFALLRREFPQWHGWKRAIPDIGRRVLITLGGSDADNVTGKIIETLRQVRVEELEAVVVAGAGNPHQGELESVLPRHGPRIELRSCVTDMPGLMAWADVAIAAGGTTSWERAFMGLPSLVIILADNQRRIAESLEQAGIGWSLGRHEGLSVSAVSEPVERLLKDGDIRAKMARRGPELVDGLGANRVVRELRETEVWLRPAGTEDCRLLWKWANEPTVRAASFNTEAIPWERHQQWFAAKLKDPGCTLLVAMNEAGMPIGQVRCDVSGSVAVISISLDPSFRGRGYGAKLIRKTSDRVFERPEVDSIHAFIRLGNDASHRTFEKAGFKKVADTAVDGHPASLLVLRK